MGNFEKLVVLTVLFLAATILGVSMHGDDEGRSDNPLDEPELASGSGTLSSLVETPPAPAVEPEPVKPQPVSVQPEAPVAQDEVDRTPAPVQPEPTPVDVPADGRRSILVNLEGLEEVYVGGDYMSYRLAPGDTRMGLAERFYGDRKYWDLLRVSNEELDQLKPGDEILVPRYDLIGEAGTRAPKGPAPDQVAPVEVPQPGPAARTYTVVEGDSLWSIALDAYGKGTLWPDIFKANRHQMKSEHDVQIGMELIIP